MSDKPPLGILPRFIWEERNPEPTDADRQARYRAVLAAMQRQWEAGLEMPDDWIDELATMRVLTTTGGPAPTHPAHWSSECHDPACPRHPDHPRKPEQRKPTADDWLRAWSWPARSRAPCIRFSMTSMLRQCVTIEWLNPRGVPCALRAMAETSAEALDELLARPEVWPERQI